MNNPDFVSLLRAQGRTLSDRERRIVSLCDRFELLERLEWSGRDLCAIEDLADRAEVDTEAFEELAALTE